MESCCSKWNWDTVTKKREERGYRVAIFARLLFLVTKVNLGWGSWNQHRVADMAFES